MAARPRLRETKQARSSATRVRLLEAAIATLCKRGYADTTTTTIAEDAGVTRGALQYHFASREAMLEAALDYLAEKRNRELLDALAAEPGPASTSEFLDLMWNSFSTDLFPATLEFFMGTKRDPGFTERLQQFEQHHSEGIRKAFSSFFGPSLFKSRDGALLVQGTLNLIRGTALMRYIAEDTGASFFLGKDGGRQQWLYWRDRIAPQFEEYRRSGEKTRSG